MNEVRLKLTRGFRDTNSEAMYGTLEVPGLGVYTSMERMWNDNIPGKSAVPAGFYTLEPHNGTKYKETFALVGESVSHLWTEGIPRSACVLHWEDDGVHLQGCISIGEAMEWRARSGKSKLMSNRISEVLHYIQGHDRVHLTIVEE